VGNEVLPIGPAILRFNWETRIRQRTRHDPNSRLTGSCRYGWPKLRRLGAWGRRRDEGRNVLDREFCTDFTPRISNL